jgi:hypothetical protein
LRKTRKRKRNGKMKITTKMRSRITKKQLRIFKNQRREIKKRENKETHQKINIKIKNIKKTIIISK